MMKQRSLVGEERPGGVALQSSRAQVAMCHTPTIYQNGSLRAPHRATKISLITITPLSMTTGRDRRLMMTAGHILLIPEKA
jgi:hypothetical protein